MAWRVSLLVLVAASAAAVPAASAQTRTARASEPSRSAGKADGKSGKDKAAAKGSKPNPKDGGNEATAYWLGGNPHVPFVTVKGRTITQAITAAQRNKSCGDAKRWSALGSQWRAVDGWGQVTGLATIDTADRYDRTKCNEVQFAPKFDRNTGGTLFVSAQAAWRPAAPARWQPSAAQSAAFAPLLAEQLSDFSQQQQKLPYRCAEGRDKVRYFKYSPAGSDEVAYGAIGGGMGGYVLATLSTDEAGKSSWKPVIARKPGPKRPICYRPISVFDMNGDGRPEIVLRFVELQDEDESWGDLLLSHHGGGWQIHSMSPGSSTK